MLVKLIIVLVVVSFIVYLYYNYIDVCDELPVTKKPKPVESYTPLESSPKASPLVLSDNSLSISLNSSDDESDESWDANFGVALITSEEKKCHFDKIQKEHEIFEDSLDSFTEYQHDESNVIKPVKIANLKSQSLIGKSIKDIYDTQVAAPKAAPRKQDNDEIGVSDIKEVIYSAAAFGDGF